MDDNLDASATGIKKMKIQDNQSSRPVQCTEEIQDTYYDRKEKPNDDEYNFTHPRRGVAVVIVNDKVLGEASRKGSQLDMEYFQSMFSHLGFAVKTYQDKTSKELMKELNAVSKEEKYEDCDCFALAVSSHGAEIFEKKGLDKSEKGRLREDVFNTKDGVLKTRMILDMFSDEQCPTLKGKPRLFFMQSCRGEALDDGVEVKLKTDIREAPSGSTDEPDIVPIQPLNEQTGDGLNGSSTVADGIPQTVHIRAQASFGVRPSTLNPSNQKMKVLTTTAAKTSQTSQSHREVDVCPAPCYKDFLVMYATPPGYYAFRRTKTGSWFVQCLYEVLSKSTGKRSLSQELTQVLGKVAFSFQSRGELSDKKQSPVIYSMLTKDIYFRSKADMS